VAIIGSRFAVVRGRVGGIQHDLFSDNPRPQRRERLSHGFGILVVSLLLPLVELQLSPLLWRLSHGHALHLPSVLSVMWAGCEWVITSAGGFPTGTFVFYGLLALAFPFAAQLLLERAEA
jgi:hypothetical protein